MISTSSIFLLLSLCSNFISHVRYCYFNSIISIWFAAVDFFPIYIVSLVRFQFKWLNILVISSSKILSSIFTSKLSFNLFLVTFFSFYFKNSWSHYLISTFYVSIICVCVCMCVCMCVFVCVCMRTQLRSTHCDPMDCSPPGSSVNGILQVRILEWVAISYSRGSS